MVDRIKSLVPKATECLPGSLPPILKSISYQHIPGILLIEDNFSLPRDLELFLKLLSYSSDVTKL